jgi:phasin family protein
MFPQFPLTAVRAHVELLLGLYVDLSQRMLEAMQSIAELNLQLGRDLLAETGGNTQRLMASKDPGQLGAAVAAQLTPGNHALNTYQRRVAEVLSRTHASMNETAAQHLPAVSRSANALTEALVQEAAVQTSRAAEQLARFQPGSHLPH